MGNENFSVIIPAYNEQDMITVSLNNLISYLQSNFSGQFE